jgi:hypothetical protein
MAIASEINKRIFFTNNYELVYLSIEITQRSCCYCPVICVKTYLLVFLFF